MKKRRNAIEKRMMYRTVVAYDVGITHLAYCLADVIGDRILRINDTKEINIMQKCKNMHCTILHDRTTHDKMSHLALPEADLAIIEFQPPTGVKTVEHWLRTYYGTKTLLVHPRSMHAYFGMRGMSREERKCFSVKRAEEDGVPLYGRKHDIADAYLMILFACCKKKVKSKYFT